MHGHFEHFKWSATINRMYCERHGYRYVTRREAPRTDRHVNWQKIPDMIAELPDCDYLLMLDADAYFYAQELTVEEELIPLLGGKKVLMPQDFGSEGERWNPGLPASGIVFLKSDDVVMNFLKDWDDSSDRDESYRWTWPLEQIALWWEIVPKYSDLLAVECEYYRIQSRYGQYIRHLMLSDDIQRTANMKRYLEHYHPSISIR